MAAYAENIMSHDDFLKLKAVVLYVINKCQTIDYFHLFKIIYFADKAHFARYGRRIIKDTYYALPNGPVPTKLYDIIKVAQGKSSSISEDFNMIINAIEFPDPTYDYILGVKEEPDIDELSASEILLLNESIEENKNVDFISLSNKSHDSAWTKAINGNKAIYDIDIATAGSASEDMINYIREINEVKTTLEL